MRFLADMGVDVRVVQWLIEHGRDAIHLRNQGLQRLPNVKFSRKRLESSASL